MRKLDLKRELKHLYVPSARKVELVDVPEMQFVMLDGRLAPGETPEASERFQQAFGALYGTAFTLKFMSKQRADDPVDYTMMALEGLWSTQSGGFDAMDPTGSQWTLMMMQPAHITAGMFRDAVERVRARRENPLLGSLRFEPFREGLCVQTMHVGPYSQEPATVERMRAFAEENGYRFAGKHHEIYLGDPRRAKPENLRTVLRYPVAPSAAGGTR